MSGLSRNAEKAILALHERWLERERTRDPAGVLACCTGDIVWLPPDGPALRGPAEIRAWLLAQPASAIRRLEITNLRLEGEGGLAYKLADFETWVESPARPAGSRVTGTHLWVLREDSPDTWRVAVVAWSVRGGSDA